MPRSAAPIADFVGPADALPALLVDYLGRVPAPETAPDAAPDAEALHGEILAEVRRTSGIDFSAYKRGTIKRRIERRMAVLHVPTLAEYAERIMREPDEASALVRELLISVTKFFRDADAFATALARTVPSIIADTPDHGELRVWVPACATGEEAYSWAIGLREAVAATGRNIGVRVFGTDVDEEALEVAMAGRYPLSAAADIGAERLARWFVTSNEHITVSRDLRSMVLFARHDVSKDPPFSRMDLVSCRNLLIYLEPPLQRRVLTLLHFALRAGRYLLLGPSETTGDLVDHFHVVSPKWKIYQAVGRPLVAEAIPAVARHRFDGIQRSTSSLQRDARVEEAERELLENHAPPALLVTESGQLVHSFGRAGQLLRIPSGTANLNVFTMVPRPLSGLLMVALPRAAREKAPLHYPGVEVLVPDVGPETISVRVRPMISSSGAAPMLLVLLERRARAAEDPVSGERLLSTEASLRDLEQELRSTKESLQSMIEELETSNEELQATNEELVSSNEELQSTNEELQSVNEELHTVNTEYQSKIDELVRLNHDVDNLLASTSVGTLFLDGDLLIRRFTAPVSRIVRVLPRDVGRPLEDLALQLPDENLLSDARGVLADKRPRERELQTPDGATYLLRVLPYTVDGVPAPGVVLTFVDVTAVKLAEARTQSVIDSLVESVALIGLDGTILAVNESWRTFAREGGAPVERTGVGVNYLDVCRGAPEDRHSRAAVEGIMAVLEGRVDQFSLEYPCDTPSERKFFMMHVAPYRTRPGREIEGAVVSHVDVTGREHATHCCPEA